MSTYHPFFEVQLHVAVGAHELEAIRLVQRDHHAADTKREQSDVQVSQPGAV